MFSATWIQGGMEKERSIRQCLFVALILNDGTRWGEFKENIAIRGQRNDLDRFALQKDTCHLEEKKAPFDFWKTV